MRFAHRSLIVVLTLLTIGTGALVIVSHARPMRFVVLEPTWFSRTVDGYPSRWQSLTSEWWEATWPGVPNPVPPSAFRVMTSVSVRDGRVHTTRHERPFQPGSENLSATAETLIEDWRSLQRRIPFTPRPDINWPLLRFNPDRFGSGEHFSMLGVSIWLPLVLFGVYPVIAFIRYVRGPFRRRRRRRKGLCVRCGYDLTGNTSGRCPECGERT